MPRIFQFVVLSFFSLILIGCDTIFDIPRTIWGSSTRALEQTREDAISKSYACDFDKCFDAIVNLGEEWSAPVTEEKEEQNKEPEVKKSQKFFKIFIQDRIRSHIVVMGIPGNVDTTEVGIFLAKLAPQAYRIDISSLSSSAKRRVAEVVFAELDRQFQPYKK